MKDMLYTNNLPKIRNLDPIACTTKYFTADSLSIDPFWYTKRGRNPIKLISNPAQIPNQCKDDTENIVPIPITTKNI